MMIQNIARRGYSPTGAGLSGEEKRKKTMQGAVTLRNFAKDLAGQRGIAGVDKALAQKRAVVAKANERISIDGLPANAGELKNKDFRIKAKRSLDIAQRYTKQIMRKQK